MSRFPRPLASRSAAVALMITLLGAACSGPGEDASPLPASPPVQASQTPGTPVEPLVGEWARTLQCPELVSAMVDAGFRDYLPDLVWGSFFWPQIQTFEEFRFDPKAPCKGARPRLHSHFFTADGVFGSRDQNGEQVDDGTYEIVGDNEVVINDVTFHYEIVGDTITFDPVLPDCSPASSPISLSDPCFPAFWSIAVASPGGAWERVG
jgi:hypothetical protein